jgi:hypothetical protein
MATSFRKIGGRQIDGDPLGGRRDGHRGKRAAHPVPGLKHGFMWQTHKGKPRQTGAERALHFYHACLNTFNTTVYALLIIPWPQNPRPVMVPEIGLLNR